MNAHLLWFTLKWLICIICKQMDVIQRVFWQSVSEPATFPVWGLSLASRALSPLLLESPSCSCMTASLRNRLQGGSPQNSFISETTTARTLLSKGQKMKQFFQTFAVEGKWFSQLFLFEKCLFLTSHSTRWCPQMLCFVQKPNVFCL